MSIGKHPTTLYTKSGTNYQSSIVGGLLSILIYLGLGYFLIVSLANVFGKIHYNIDVSTTKLNAYTQNG